MQPGAPEVSTCPLGGFFPLTDSFIVFCDPRNLVSQNFLQYPAGSAEVRQWRSK
jgi:hypothetical protein